MSFTLPPQAEDYFNGQAHELLLLLEHRQNPGRQARREVESSVSHSFIAANLHEEDIIDPVSVSTIDYLGVEQERYFETAHGFFGFSGENYTKVEKIINDISRKKELQNLVSEEFIRKMFFEWVEGRFKNRVPMSYKLLDYIKGKSEKEIKNRKISIPIDFLSIQSKFRIGNIEFEYYHEELFNNIEGDIRNNVQENTQNIEFTIRRIRQKYQGKAYTSINICSETQKCIEIAKSETEKSLVILLFFSMSALHPRVPSYVGRMGSVQIPMFNIFAFEEHIPRIFEGYDEKKDIRLHIDDEYVRKMNELHVEKFSELLTRDKLSSIEDLLINCINIYVKGVRSKDFQDKIVFTLVSIETLLLRDNQEPIQASVGLRLAFLYGKNTADRKRAIKIIKDAYIYRSRYIHHGNKSKEDFELLQSLQLAVWTAIYNVVMLKDRFKSQEELLDAIQDQILS